MGGDQSGAALLADEAEEFGEDEVGGAFVEIAGGLVGEDQRGLVGEGAGDGDSLLLAAGELGGLVGQPFGEAERAEQAFGAGLRVLCARRRRRAGAGSHSRPR